jgi:pimeloyl-ACP methyl ester carboxylesterase
LTPADRTEHRPRARASAFLAAALLAAVTQMSAASAPAPLTLTPCRLPDLATPARCGSLEVYEDRDARSGRKISLRIAVLPAGNGAPAPDPLFILVGGPGQAAIPTAPAFSQIFRETLAGRDVVLVDLRGTGNSHPLECKLTGSDDDPQSYLGDMFPLAAIRACRAKLDANPALYTTSIAMDDLDDVRAALGYERINLYGSSYGSRAALVYMRRHPAHVRSVILRGVVPTNMRTPLYYARDSQRALDLLFTECKADPACHAAYPDLERQWQEVQARLARGPVEADVDLDGVVPPAPAPQAAGKPPAGGEANRPGGSAPAAAEHRHAHLRITRDDFNETIRYRLYSEESNQIPRYIARAYTGDYSQVAKLALILRRLAARGEFLSVGAYLSVTCSEDVPFIGLAEARRLAAGTFLGTYRVDEQVRACTAWPRGKLPAGYLDDVTSPAPALLLSGVRDPVAPPVWGEQVARRLEHATFVPLPHGYHGLPGACVSKLMNAFVIQGGAKGLDTACVQEVPVPPFVLPDGRTAATGEAGAAPPVQAAAPRPPAAMPATPATPEKPANAGSGAAAGPPSAEALWAGTLIYRRAELEVDVVVELARDAQGKWVGTIDVPNQNMKFFPLANIRAGGTDVYWEFNRFAHKAGVMVETPFTGTLSADGSTMSGDFFEGRKDHVPLVLRRQGEAGSPREEPPPAPVTLLSDSGEELKAAFNRDAGKTRLLMLLSPT